MHPSDGIVGNEENEFTLSSLCPLECVMHCVGVGLDAVNFIWVAYCDPMSAAASDINL
jgi:hypothetical protein